MTAAINEWRRKKDTVHTFIYFIALCASARKLKNILLYNYDKCEFFLDEVKYLSCAHTL